MGDLLILTGIFIIVIGVILKLSPEISGFPLLPGDILIKKDNLTFYFPIVTSILLSLLITLILNLFR